MKARSFFPATLVDRVGFSSSFQRAIASSIPFIGTCTPKVSVSQVILLVPTDGVWCDSNHTGLDFHRAWAGYLTQSRVGISPLAGRYLTQLRVITSPSCGLGSHPHEGRYLTQSRVVISPSRGSLSHPVVGRYLTQSRVVISPSRGSLSHLVTGRNLTHSRVVISLFWGSFYR